MVDRAFSVIEYISDHNNSIGISQIAHELDLPKATIFRILNTLHKWDILEKSSDDKYNLGKGLIKYGNKAKDRMDLISISSPIAKKLSQSLGETVNIGIKYRDNILNIYSEEGECSSLISKLIPISPLNCSSMGKIFLSHFTNDEIISYFQSNSIEKRTINSIVDIQDFLKIRDAIAHENLAFDDEEYEYGLSCIASGIKDQYGNIVAAINVSGPTSRLRFKGIDKIKEELINSAKIISQSTSFI